MNLNNALVWLHVTGNVVWIGAIVAVALLLTAASGDVKVRGELARRVYLRAAVPAFVASFVGGTARMLMDVGYYLKEHHWMHGKLLFAVIAIGIHHVLGARARKMAAGEVDNAGPAPMLLAVFALSAAAAVFFVIFRFPD